MYNPYQKIIITPGEPKPSNIYIYTYITLLLFFFVYFNLLSLFIFKN